MDCVWQWENYITNKVVPTFVAIIYTSGFVIQTKTHHLLLGYLQVIPQKK